MLKIILATIVSAALTVVVMLGLEIKEDRDEAFLKQGEKLEEIVKFAENTPDPDDAAEVERWATVLNEKIHTS